MIDRDVALLLIGTALGLVSAIVGALVQHLLSLRADRIKRERDRGEEKAKELRQAFSIGVSEFAEIRNGIIWPKPPRRGYMLKLKRGYMLKLKREKRRKKEGLDLLRRKD